MNPCWPGWCFKNMPNVSRHQEHRSKEWCDDSQKNNKQFISEQINNKKILESCSKPKDNPTLHEMVKIHFNLNCIQTRSNQMWNCDGIGFDPNGNWHKIVCTYKFSPEETPGRHKHESDIHSSMNFLFLPYLMVNDDSCRPSWYTKKRSTLNISTLKPQWTG